ncbi:hypothetical protein [Shewanella glacialipiscicola]|uniref:hypothetical protein n=1 Tax=Shewanella glacialipiscicola TaxID=614069 RepID=UPI003D7A7528
MPCIIDPNHQMSQEQASSWKSLCGKTLFFGHNPFKSVQEAQNSSKPICKVCRKLAGLPPKEVVRPQFIPYVLYKAYQGELGIFYVTGETNTQFRTDVGQYLPKYLRSSDLYWVRSGSEASQVFYSKDMAEALAMAEKQLQQRRHYLQSLIDETVKLQTLLKQRQ